MEGEAAVKIEIDLEAISIDEAFGDWSLADEIRNAISKEVSSYVRKRVKAEIEAAEDDFSAFVSKYTRVALQNAVDAVEANPPEVVLEKRLGL